MPPSRLIASRPSEARNWVAIEDRPPTAQTQSTFWPSGTSPTRSCSWPSGCGSRSRCARGSTRRARARRARTPRPAKRHRRRQPRRRESPESGTSPIIPARREPSHPEEGNADAQPVDHALTPPVRRRKVEQGPPVRDSRPGDNGRRDLALVEGIPGEFGPQPWGEAILRNCGVLLLKITRRPADHEIRLPGLATTPRHVVEEQTGKALTWRRDGDDLVVRLPSGPLPALTVIKVALQGKLRIVPPDTTTANADGVWDLAPEALSRATFHLVARRTADVGVRLIGGRGRHAADRGTRAGQRVPGAGRRHAYGVPVAEVVGQVIGPFPVRAGQVVRLSVAGLVVTRALVAPVGTVLASVHSKHGDLEVQVTNFGRTAARGTVRVPAPAGWHGDEDEWDFEGLAPGATIGRKLRLGAKKVPRHWSFSSTPGVAPLRCLGEPFWSKPVKTLSQGNSSFLLWVIGHLLPVTAPTRSFHAAHRPQPACRRPPAHQYGGHDRHHVHRGSTGRHHRRTGSGRTANAGGLDATGYWTAEKLKNAIPADLPGTTGAPSPQGESTRQAASRRTRSRRSTRSPTTRCRARRARCSSATTA